MAPGAASAAVFTVDAAANSTYIDLVTPGTGLATGISVTAGVDTLTISASSLDLWSSGFLPRFSTADGQVGNLLAVAGDDSLQPIGTLIGELTPSQFINGFMAPTGALVGEIGGNYQILGTGFNGLAWGTGQLNLYFWDVSAIDNTGSISVAAAVPEPATWALMMAGFGILGFGLRRRTATASRVSFNFA